MVRVVERYLPDPFVFVLLLTAIAGFAAMITQGSSPIEVVRIWGDGFWSLLTFSMQMLLILATGYLMATTPFVKGLLESLAYKTKSAGGAILMVTFVSLTASWINWGFGLVVGALFARELARIVAVDYRLLVASAYSGFIVWHGGLAGSIPLSIASEGHPFASIMGTVPTSETIFSTYNLIIVGVLFVVTPLVNRAIMPRPYDTVYVDPALLVDDYSTEKENDTPAGRLERSKLLSGLIGVAGAVWLLQHFLAGKGISLNVINFLFLTVAIILHGNARNLLNSLSSAVKSGAGIVIQFPFYAGVMAIMVKTGLAASISAALVSMASEATLPLWTFISAGVVNFFVPSGGGQWAVQAPVVLEAAKALNADFGRIAMAVAWGDAWTNMVQPFWALPILGIAGLKAKDIMGFCVMHTILSGFIIGIGLTFL